MSVTYVPWVVGGWQAAHTYLPTFVCQIDGWENRQKIRKEHAYTRVLSHLGSVKCKLKRQQHLCEHDGSLSHDPRQLAIAGTQCIKRRSAAPPAPVHKPACYTARLAHTVGYYFVIIQTTQWIVFKFLRTTVYKTEVISFEVYDFVEKKLNIMFLESIRQNLMFYWNFNIPNRRDQAIVLQLF